MKFYYISDLHYDVNGAYVFEMLKPKDASESTLIIAGDLHSKGRSVMVAEHFADFFKYVIWVSGNHEYYNLALHETHKFISDKPNVFFLDNDLIYIEGVKVFGCTLWHPLNVELDVLWRYCMNDPRQIRGKDYKRLVWQDINLMHEESLYLIENTNADILVTHHALSEKSINKKYKGQMTNKFYATNHPELISKFKHYIHGHMHSSVNYKINGCFVHCNPLGYNTELVDKSIIKENLDFSLYKCFEI